MTTLDDVRRIAIALPGVQAATDGFAFSVPFKGKKNGFVWLWNERVEPKKPKVPNPGVLAVRVPNLGIKELLLTTDQADTGNRKIFTEPHYDGYPAVLVRLVEIDADELAPMIVEAWRCMASPALRAQYDQTT